MRHVTLIPVTALLLGGAVVLPAEDGDATWTDIRLEGSILPDEFDYDAEAEFAGLDVGLSGEEEWDNAYRVALAAQSLHRGDDDSPLGFSAGGALSYQRLEFDEDADEAYEALALTARLGLGVVLGEVFHLEVLPFAGIGASRGEIGDDESDDVGLYWEYGIMAGGYFTFGNSFQLGVHGGWIHSEYNLDFGEDERFEDLVEEVEVELENEGLFFGVSIGIRV